MTRGVERAVPLVDHHCHGIVAADLDRSALEDLLTESSFRPAAGTSTFDTPLGLAVRRWCAPVLDLPALAQPEAYVERRRELGGAEVNRRLLRASGTGTLLVETGYRPHDIESPAALGELSGAEVHEVVRVEAVAEQVREGVRSGRAFVEELPAALAARASKAVGLKTIVAYRGGFAFDPAPPPRDQVVAAADGFVRGGDRLTDETLLRYGIWTAADVARSRRLPIQVHSGLGDPDLVLHLANPSFLTGLIRELGRLEVDLVLLHCYPYHREAAYLTSVFPNVYMDVGLALNHTGVQASRVLAEAMELAPFPKLLYSSDAFGLAELYLTGAVLFRRALAELLEAWVDQEACTAADADRITGMVSRDNASRLYRL
ncbi:MAG: amidohydrolase family protein [Candidatus Dormibacteraeota bacterium]|nr:amidohydrolase family protein [Candidatus Dormibacteraeota bacterium]MBO0704266.1 amidohydrolase family protein [Candidatus Dormibacteraeota bacterium]MBO0762436.1 amidohydrolase family protein [Candidatus Dormibacteraeota bacterium]